MRKRLVSPGFVDPMLPTLVPRAPAGDEWIYEIKHDGYRTILIKWQKRADGNQPYRFVRNDLEPLAFAGIWEFARLGGEVILSVCIIVGEPNPLSPASTTVSRATKPHALVRRLTTQTIWFFRHPVDVQ